MANDESNKFSSNLKVPPLKIVLSVHQNNTVVNLGNVEEEESLKSNVRDDNSNDHTDHESGRRNGSIDVVDSSAGDASGKQHRKNSKTSSTDRGNDNPNNESGQLSASTTVYSSSSSSSSSSDRSNSTTPSSESESLASNSTIISEHHHSHQQQQQMKNKGEIKDETSASGSAGGGGNSIKQERLSRIGSKGTTSEKFSDRSSNKRLQDGGNADHSGDSITSTNAITTGSKEQSLNANQRITRSSQRAAQQNKMENSGDQNGEELNVAENHEKALESVRKVKRRKGEIQESEQEISQSAQQLTVAMANIYPADYQIPSQNSFELYRDIRKRPHKKLMKLSHIQPKVPHGFKDYLINGGPYLLDGNKLGVGLSGPRLDSSMSNRGSKLGTNASSRPLATLKMRYTTPQKKTLLHPTNQRHTSYSIPKISEAPRTLQVGSPLYELFQDQEKARHQMRMQHLKERERAIMAAEQEILRAYNRAAIASNKQKLHLSACTYFYYQESYHYIDEKSGLDGQKESKEVPHSQDNSFLCIEGGESATKTVDNNGAPSKDSKCSSTDNVTKGDGNFSKDEKKVGASSSDGDQDGKQQVAGRDAIAGMDKHEDSTNDRNGSKFKTVSKSVQLDTNGSNQTSASRTGDNVMTSTKTTKDPTEGELADFKEREGTAESNNKNDDRVKNVDLNSEDNNVEESSADAKTDPKAETISDEDLKILNKEVFIKQLQDIDDKWDKIKRDMLVRHKNEADSLHAVQTLEWEWKAKEIGVCDVRVSLKVEPEFVPRVDVAALDY